MTKVTESTPDIAKAGFRAAIEKREAEAARKAEEERAAKREYINDPDRAIEVFERAKLIQKIPAAYQQDAFVQVVAQVPVSEGVSIQEVLTGKNDKDEYSLLSSFALGAVCMGIAVVLYALVSGGIL